MEAPRYGILYRLAPVFITLWIFTLFCQGCSGGGGGGSVDYDMPVTQVQGVMGENGGELAVVDTGTPADGAKVIIPEAALTTDQTITISYGETDLDTLTGIDPAGVPIDFGPDGLNFNTPVYISIPYFDDDNDGIIDGTDHSEYDVALIYFNEPRGEWENVPIANRSPGANLVEAETDHFSTYLVALDTATATVNDGEDADNDSAYQTGEYFVGTPEYRITDPGSDINTGDGRELIVAGCIGQDLSTCSQDDSCNPCATPYVLTVTASDNRVKAVIDRNATYGSGHPATLNEAGTAITFDAANIFEKIDQSGDADLWTWKCEFIPEHTNLQQYVLCDDNRVDAICSAADEEFYADIEVVDKTTLSITFGIDISDTLGRDGQPLTNMNFGGGDMIAIRFEANYK